MPLWGGAFDAPTDDDLRRLNDSLPFDQRMAAQDVRGSIAYAGALAAAGVIALHEAAALIAGLEQIAAELAAGTFAFAPGDEDIHTAVERRLTEIAGPVGGKLHTGRSRNDQVATDFRLWTADAADDLRSRVRVLQTALIDQAEAHADTLMPGYTHLQPAQPITAGHWLLSYVWMLQRDAARLTHAADVARSLLPLGAGALAGTPFPIDRAALARELGFAAPSPNSLDAVSDRDFAADLLYACTLTAVHLSRLAEDIILFSNPAFGFIALDDRYSTGSSLMPQKRNPDPLELTRGKAGRLIGDLTGFLSTLKGLPTGYNKDLQEDKEAVFDAVDALTALLPVLTAVIATLTLNPERLRAALDPAMLATDLADYLVLRGIPFREAHHLAGRAVRLAADQGVPLSALTAADLATLSPAFGDDAAAVFDFAASVARRRILGGTAPDAVREQITHARAVVGDAAG